MVPTITRAELKQKIDRGDEFYLVETLSDEQFREGHLPGAIHLPPGRLAELAPQLLPDPVKEVIVYCTNPECRASEFAARMLTALGYQNVRRYPGGKQEWLEAELPLLTR
ncbi:MAG: rhodanese-like domain-containing protein [Bryobacteraceae bacterium]